MDIMMRLTGSGFSAIANEFRAREHRLGGGLPLIDFVEIVLQGLPRARSVEDRIANVSALVDLFEDIDVNGDGVMEFDEFTSFCVDAGMVATRTQTTTIKHRYVRDTRHVIKTANGSMGIEKIKWSPECRKFMVIEHAAKAVKLFTADGCFVAEVGAPVLSDSTSTSQPGSSGGGTTAPSSDLDRSDKRDELQDGPAARKTRTATTSPSANASSNAAAASVFVLDAVFVPKFHWLVTSTTDFSIAFFDMDESRNPALARVLPGVAAGKPSASYELLKPLTITTTTAQLLLRFCAQSSLLVGSGNDFVVNIWRILDGETKVLWKRLLTHQDMIMDFLEVPQHDLLVSCDLRHSIQLWESQNCRSRGALVGHVHGVRQVVYSAHHDLLLSAGFEFEAYAWDLGSRQVVMKLAGHRAPLVGVQLALFQTERAITADIQGVFKVWDISRSSSVSGLATTSSSSRQSGGPVSSTMHAVQLESIEPALQFTRFEPIAFVSLYPLSRDLWTSTAGSSTVHRFQSKRIQQFDEIPLSGFYHYNANKFVVVSGSVCSIWDGDSGVCMEEFTHVGGVGAADLDRDSSVSGDGSGGNGAGKASKGNNHSGAENGQAQDQTSEILVCAHDAKCRKLVVVSETGYLGVFNCLNFVQMRHCLERFNGAETNSTPSTVSPMARSASSRIVGLHYCSNNKLVILADATTSAIVIVDDNVSHDSANGTKRTPVLRRVVNIPGGVATSAYSYHASLVATVAEADGMLVSLWDFETLALVAQCQIDDEYGDAVDDAGNKATTANRIQALHFWDEFPVLLAADSLGRVLVFAVMPLIHAYAGQLLHVFVNSYSSRPSGPSIDSESVHTNDSSTSTSDTADSSFTENGNESASTADGSSSSTKPITGVAENAAQKMLLRTRQKRSVSVAASQRSGINAELSASESHSTAPSLSSADPPAITLATTISSAVTSMRIALDEVNDRHVLFSGDENGNVAVWDLSVMAKQLALTKIPEVKLKCTRRGYHPKATFSRDYAKESLSMLLPHEKKHHQPVFHGDWRRSMLLGEDMADMDVRAAQMDLKRLSKRRIEVRRRPGTVAGSCMSASKQQLQQLSPAAMSGRAPQASGQADAAVGSAVAAAEAFLGSGQRKVLNAVPTSGVVAARVPSSSAFFSSSQSSRAARGRNTRAIGSIAGSSRSGQSTDSGHALVTAICRWQAHRDAITSVEVTRNPNIIVTCSLDTRVFVWDWQGERLGKLFDAENSDSDCWRFHKSDAKRQHERDQVILDIMRELDRTPQEKLQQRRQTLYEEHVGRRSQTELQHVNAMLLDHIISKNPELEAMEKAVNTTRDHSTPTSSKTLSGDTEISAALEGSRQRNRHSKFKMLAKLQNAVALAAKHKVGGRTPSTLEIALMKQTELRMTSLNQVGPLLCVDQFGYRDSSMDPNGGCNGRKLPVTSTPEFADHGDIRMDKEYLEKDLAVSTDTSSQTSNGSSITAVKEQIHAEHLAAEAAVENRAALERKARELYSNMEAVKTRFAKDKRLLPQSSSSASSPVVLGMNPTLEPDTARLLEPSEFLKKHLPESVLSFRPQTAPLHRTLSPQSIKTKPLQLSSSSSSPALAKKSPSRAKSASTRHQLRDSGSEPALAAVDCSGNSPHTTDYSERKGSLSVFRHRRSSLDELFLGEMNRQSLSPVSLPSPYHEGVTGVPGRGEAVIRGSDVDNDGASLHLQHSHTKSSLQKLMSINEIISRAHDYSSVTGRDSGDTHGCLEDDRSDSLSHDVDEESVREHLESTKDRMRAAMYDGEWSSSHQQMIKKRRQAAQQQQKARRMEDYLQQKRREMNTGIGNVFKHTSFAFQSAAADDHQSRDRQSGRRRSTFLSSTGAKSGGRRKSKAIKAKKQSAFGIYSAREVMSVIRLFWSMDEDASGTISQDELLQYKHFFEKLGHSDMATVFQSIDKDGNGQVSLRELLEVCFHYATKYQLEEMLKLAKLGSVRLYFQGEELSTNAEESGGVARALPAGQGNVTRGLQAEHRRELLQIFQLFDANGDGGVSMQEIMEALRVDDDDVMAAVMAKASRKKGSAGALVTSGITREDIEKLYREFDRDGNAELDFDEFVALMRTLYCPRGGQQHRTDS